MYQQSVDPYHSSYDLVSKWLPSHHKSIAVYSYKKCFIHVVYLNFKIQYNMYFILIHCCFVVWITVQYRTLQCSLYILVQHNNLTFYLIHSIYIKSPGLVRSKKYIDVLWYIFLYITISSVSSESILMNLWIHKAFNHCAVLV